MAAPVSGNGRRPAGTRGPQRDERLEETRDWQMIVGLWRFVRPYRGLFLISMGLDRIANPRLWRTA